MPHLAIADDRTGVIDMDQKAVAAKRRFPERGQAIDELAARDDEFASLCVDLADAEAAAQHWAESMSPKRDERRDEYVVLADELAKEIETKLDKVVFLSLRGCRPDNKP